MQIAILTAILLGVVGIAAVLLILAVGESSNSNAEDESNENPYPDTSFDVGHEDVHSEIAITDVTEVNTHTDGEPILTATLEFEAATLPDGTMAVCEILPDLVRTFDSFHVRYFEFHCHPEDGVEYCEKMGMSQFHAEKYAEEDTGAKQMIKELKQMDTGDDGAAPFVWMQCDYHQEPTSHDTSGDAAATTAATTAATSASASCTTTSTTC